MTSLEHKVPPPLVALAIALAMWGVARLAPSVGVALPFRAVLGGAIALAGGGFSLAGALAFRRARTTVNPLRPQAASTLVSGGVYRLTRNPMYVGLLLVLCGWAVWLASAWALAGPVGFWAFIGRFQIAPEERALDRLFGADYAAYRARVRRWL